MAQRNLPSSSSLLWGGEGDFEAEAELESAEDEDVGRMDRLSSGHVGWRTNSAKMSVSASATTYLRLPRPQGRLAISAHALEIEEGMDSDDVVYEMEEVVEAVRSSA